MTAPRRIRRAVVVLLVLLAGAAVVYASRRPLLQTVGAVLVADDQPVASDVIVISVDVGGAGVLEAAELVHAGIASRVAIFAHLPDLADRELSRRGAPYEDDAALAVRQLTALGVRQIEQIPGTVNGTESEGQLLPQWGAARGYRSVLLVTSADHARRTRRVMRREAPSGNIRVLVKGARYSGFDPDRWWLTRNAARTGIVETQKLLLDVLRHPFS